MPPAPASSTSLTGASLWLEYGAVLHGVVFALQVPATDVLFEPGGRTDGHNHPSDRRGNLQRHGGTPLHDWIVLVAHMRHVGKAPQWATPCD
jgi:hypothetical protein